MNTEGVSLFSEPNPGVVLHQESGVTSMAATN